MFEMLTTSINRVNGVMMEAISMSEMPINFYETTLNKIPEDSLLHQQMMFCTVKKHKPIHLHEATK
jgi:hypothetical protein